MSQQGNMERICVDLTQDDEPVRINLNLLSFVNKFKSVCLKELVTLNLSITYKKYSVIF